MKKSELKSLIQEVIKEFKLDKGMTNPYVPFWVDQIFKALRSLFSAKMMGGKLDLSYDENKRKITCKNVNVAGIHTVTITAESEIDADNLHPWDKARFTLEILTDSDYHTKSGLYIKEVFMEIKRYISDET